jgi:hypothetical protein
MSASTLEQLNLSPQERRIIVIIAVVVFVVLNMLLVWPHFKDLARVHAQLADTRKKISDYNDEISKDIEPKDGYKVRLAKLQKQQGGGVVNQQVALQKSVSDQAIRTGVNIFDTRPASSKNPETNAFYDEQDVRISFDSGEDQLINFLFNVGNDPAMIRVRELNLHTLDANRYRLKGDALLSANYAKATTATLPPGRAAAPKPAAAPEPRPPVIPGHTPSPNAGANMKPAPNMHRAPNARPGQ